jgi:3-oxoadipate enol-lactonase
MSPVEVPFEIEGPADAPVLMLSNSLGSTMAMWEPNLPRLAEAYRVVRYDHRGHGRAPSPPEPWEIADLAEDAIGLLDRLEVDRAHFCGLSLGGMVGMWLGAHAPGRIDRLVLCCTSAMLALDTDWAQRADTVRRHGTGAVAAAVVQRWLTPDFRAARPELTERLQAMIASTPAEGYAACCGAIERMDLTPVLGAVQASTLVIVGAEDPATPRPHAERIADGIPDAHVATVAGAHLASVETPDEVSELILSHLRGEER